MQHGLLLCGGYVDRSSAKSNTCEKFNEVTGSWDFDRNLTYQRIYHSFWNGPEGILLIGGQDSTSRKTTELLTESGSIERFVLKHDGEQACLIDEGNSFLLTGGSRYASNVAVRYNKDGWMEDLNSMNTIRRGHACLQYTDSENIRSPNYP